MTFVWHLYAIKIWNQAEGYAVNFNREMEMSERRMYQDDEDDGHDERGARADVDRRSSGCGPVG